MFRVFPLPEKSHNNRSSNLRRNSLNEFFPSICPIEEIIGLIEGSSLFTYSEPTQSHANSDSNNFATVELSPLATAISHDSFNFSISASFMLIVLFIYIINYNIFIFFHNEN